MSLFKKKPKNDNLEELRDITDDVIEGDFVPYACHWDPYTIVTKNGEVLQTIKITGFTHEQLVHDNEESDLRSQIREAITTCINTTDYAVWIHTIRRKANLQTKGEFKRDFSGYLNRFWNDRNDWEHQFSNEVYVTVVRTGQLASLSDPAGFARGIIPRFDIRNREAYLDDSRDKLNAVTTKMLPILQRYGAKRLGIERRGDKYYSEISEFLGKIITMLDLEFPITDVDMAHYLTDYDVTFGFNAMEVRMRESGMRRFGAILTLKEYRELPIDSLEKFLQIPAEFIVTQCFDFIGAAEAIGDLQYQKWLFNISKATTLAERSGLNDILSSHKGRPIDFGENQLGVFLLADSIRSLEASVTKAVSALGGLGMLPLREDIKFEECYWAQLPANFEFIKRMKPINTVRLGGFANLRNFPAGIKENNHWGPAVTTFYTAAHTPYFFNFHEGDNGHTTIIGPFGAGKTVLMNFLLSQSRKFDGKLFFLDKDRSSEILIRSLGGAYYNPYPKADTREYAHVSLNPFQLEDTPKNREFLSQWVMLLIPECKDTKVSSACTKAIASVMQKPKSERCLALFVGFLGAENPAYAQLFESWIAEGEHASLWQGVPESLNLSDKIYGLEMGDVLKYPATIVPVLSYILHRIVEALDGSPTIIVVDEAWTLLDNPYFSAHLKDWLDMLRSRNAMVIMATEHVEEAAHSHLNATLMDHIATQIYLPDEEAGSTYAKAFGLTAKEITYLTMMNLEDRHFLLKRGHDTIVAELSLSGMTDIIAVLSATEEHLKIMEQVIDAHGLTPAQWMPKFLELI